MRLLICSKCNGERFIVTHVKLSNGCETITKLICKGCNGKGMVENELAKKLA
jgi:DnaJ-class molecular chaperone